MKDESKILYIGQLIGTATLVGMYKSTNLGDYAYNHVDLQEFDLNSIQSPNVEIELTLECSCGKRHQRTAKTIYDYNYVYTTCHHCSKIIHAYLVSENKKRRQTKKDLAAINKPTAPKRIIDLPKHILAANNIYHPGVEQCYELLELFPTIPDGWAIRKLDKSSTITVDNLFVINTMWAENKYKECKLIEDNFEPSCNAEYLGKGQYRAICNSCGKIHKIPYSNIYSHHDPIYKNTPTKRRCKCLPKSRIIKTKQQIDEDFLKLFEKQCKEYNLLEFSESHMAVLHKPCGTKSELKRGVSYVKACKTCRQLRLNKRVTDNIYRLFGDKVKLIGDYAGKGKLTNWVCSEGHTFKKSYKVLKCQTGCPQCADFITDLTQPMILYYLRVNTEPPMYKIGITKNTVRKRFKRDPVALLTELKVWKYEVGQDAYNREQEILEIYKEFRYNGKKVLKSEGNTEIFTKDILGLDK